MIDIINRASELVILAVGMTLVVSSSAGTDISVGAIMAVSAAVCCNILTGGERAVTAYANPLILGFIAALVVGAAIGCFNGLFSIKVKYPAYGGNSDHVYCRQRYCTADHRRTDHLCACRQLSCTGRFISRDFRFLPRFIVAVLVVALTSLHFQRKQPWACTSSL